MSTLVEQLVNTEAHQSIFETAVRQNPLPVCAAFGSSSNPQPVSFSNTPRVLTTKDSDGVRAQFPQTVAASGNSYNQFNHMGVAYPASDPAVLAVGGTWTGDFGGPWTVATGATDYTTDADRIAAFSQRSDTLLDIFA